MRNVMTSRSRRLLSLAMLALCSAPSLAADYTIKAGSTDVTVYMTMRFYGDYEQYEAPETGLAYDSLNLKAYYVRTRGAATQIPLVTKTVTGDHADGGFVQVDSANMPGVYRLDLPDAACAAGVPNVRVTLYDADNGKPFDVVDIDLVAYDPQDSTPAVDVTQIAGSSTAGTQLAEAFDNDGTGGDLDVAELSVTEGATIATSDSNESALVVTGNGTGSGVQILSGSGASGTALRIESLATDGTGVAVYGSGDGNGLYIVGGSGAIGDAVVFQSEATTGTALSLYGSGNGHGLIVDGGVGTTSDATGNFSGSVGSVGAGGITSNSFGSGAIDATAVAANAIGSSELADGAIDAGALATDAITASKVGTGAIDADSLAADAGTELGTANWASATRTLSAATNITSSGGTITTASGAVTVGTNNDKSDYALSTSGVAGVWNALTSGMSTTGSIGKRIVDNLNAEIGDLPPLSYFEALFEGAPTFAEAMDDHGYTMDRAKKIDKLAPSLLVSTTIDGTPSSNTTLVLAAGPPDDNALNGALVIVTDATDDTQKAVGLVKDYDKVTKTVTLVADPGVFEFDDGDKVDVIAGGAAIPLWLSGP